MADLKFETKIFMVPAGESHRCPICQAVLQGGSKGARISALRGDSPLTLGDSERWCCNWDHAAKQEAKLRQRLVQEARA